MSEESFWEWAWSPETLLELLVGVIVVVVVNRFVFAGLFWLWQVPLSIAVLVGYFVVLRRLDGRRVEYG